MPDTIPQNTPPATPVQPAAQTAAQPAAHPVQAGGGFNVPPAPGAATSPGGAPSGVQSPQQAPQGPDLNAAIAALTQALQPADQPAGTTGTTEVPGSIEPGELPRDLNSVDIDGLNDPVLQSMAYAMTAGAPKGFDLNRAMGLALERGDSALVDVAYIRDKFGADAEHRIRIAQGIVQSVQQQSQAAAEGAYAEAGGREQWQVSAGAFNSQAPEELKLAVVQLLDSGDPNLVKAGARLVVQFSRSAGVVPQQGQHYRPGAATPAPAMALDKHGFQAELRKLDPYSREFESQRAELFRRRELGRQLGR